MIIIIFDHVISSVYCTCELPIAKVDNMTLHLAIQAPLTSDSGKLSFSLSVFISSIEVSIISTPGGDHHLY